MISLTAIDFDLHGHLMIHELPTADLSTLTRRANRVATLDGGAVINDTGHSPADRTFTVRWRLRHRAEQDRAQHLLRMHRYLYVSSREGLFTALPQQLSVQNGEAVLTLLIQEKFA